MKENIKTALAVLLAMFVFAFVVAWYMNKHEMATVQKMHEQATFFQKQAEEAKHDAESRDVLIAQRDEVIKGLELDAKLSRASYERVRARVLKPEPGAEKPNPEEVIASADTALADQDKVDAEKDAKIEDLTASRDSWKAAYEAENKRAVALQIALDACKHAQTSSKWLGRIQGFAIGVSIGYVGGKLH